MEYRNCPWRIVGLLSCVVLTAGLLGVMPTPKISTDGIEAELVWESFPSWYLQYASSDLVDAEWKRVSGSLGAGRASITLDEERYFFRLIEGSPFQQVTLPIAGGTVDLGNGLSMTVPENAWYSNEMGSVDLEVRVRSVEPFEADQIIINKGLLDKSFLGGVEIQLVADHSLNWYEQVIIKFPALQPIGNSTVPVGATMSLEQGIYNLGPTDIVYDFDTESLEMRISNLLPTASGNDYREHQDSILYCVLGADLGGDSTKYKNLSLDVNLAPQDTLPPTHPCRSGLIHVQEESSMLDDSLGCFINQVTGKIIYFDCGETPVEESWNLGEWNLFWIKVDPVSPMYIGETAFITTTLLDTKGKLIGANPLQFTSLTTDVVEVLDSKNGNIRAKACGIGKVRITGPCDIEKIVTVKVESKVEEVIVTLTDVLLDYDEFAKIEVLLFDGDGAQVTKESHYSIPDNTNIFWTSDYKDFTTVDAKRDGGVQYMWIKAGCKDLAGNQPISEAIRIEVVKPELTIQPEADILSIGETLTLAVSLRGKNDQPLPQEEIQWTSTLGNSCSFNENTYTVEALDKGSGMIIAKYKGVEAFCRIWVAGDLVLSPTEATIQVGERVFVQVYMFDAGGNEVPVEDQMQNIIWNVSDESIISFDTGQWMVTGLKYGTATLSATIAGQQFVSTFHVVPPNVRVYWSGSNFGGSSAAISGEGYSFIESRSEQASWSGHCILERVGDSYQITELRSFGSASHNRDFYRRYWYEGGGFDWVSESHAAVGRTVEDQLYLFDNFIWWANNTDFTQAEITNPFSLGPTAPYAHYINTTESAWETFDPLNPGVNDSGSESISEEYDANLGFDTGTGIVGIPFFSGDLTERMLQKGSPGGVFSAHFNESATVDVGVSGTFQNVPFSYWFNTEVHVFVDGE